MQLFTFNHTISQRIKITNQLSNVNVKHLPLLISLRSYLALFADEVAFSCLSGAILRWPKKVNHKSVYQLQNTKQFPKTQINFPKHKLVSQNTNRFLKTQINFPKHKSISQNTNQFLKTRTSLPKHKPSSRNTNQWTGHLLCNYQREPGRDSFPGISASNMATSSCE